MFISVSLIMSTHHSAINVEFERKIHKSVFNLNEIFS